MRSGGHVISPQRHTRANKYSTDIAVHCPRSIGSTRFNWNWRGTNENWNFNLLWDNIIILRSGNRSCWGHHTASIFLSVCTQSIKTGSHDKPLNSNGLEKCVHSNIYPLTGHNNKKMGKLAREFQSSPCRRSWWEKPQQFDPSTYLEGVQIPAIFHTHQDHHPEDHLDQNGCHQLWEINLLLLFEKS